MPFNNTCTFSKTHTQCALCIHIEGFNTLVLSLCSGVVTIPDGMTVDFNLNGDNFQFTLTCISTGGPATTVTWTRDSVTVTEGTETLLDNRTTSQYTHTLTVTERLGGDYTCTVANNRPSNNVTSKQLTVQGTIMFVQTSEHRLLLI